MPQTAGRIICNYCGEYRVIRLGDLNNLDTSLAVGLSMYIVHLIIQHPDRLRKAEEMAATLTPLFDWRLAQQ